MNILFYAGETAISYAFPQVGAALTTVRYARTAYNVARASASIFSGDFVSGGLSLASMGVSYLVGPTMGPQTPGGPPGISAEYINCINNCALTCAETWTLNMCMAGCSRFL